MFNESYNKKQMNDAEVVGLSTVTEESMNRHFIGEVSDVLIDVETGERTVLPISYNTVVNNASVLIAALIKRHAGYAGALFWEVGSGDPAWSDSAPPAPAVTDFKLQTPVFRKAIQLTDMSFIDGANAVSATPTNRLQIVVKFLTTEANGYLREFGIFGGGADAVVGTLGSGLMINRKTHGVIYKTSGMELERTIRFTF
jgi:hypothetical protein